MSPCDIKFIIPVFPVKTGLINRSDSSIVQALLHVLPSWEGVLVRFEDTHPVKALGLEEVSVDSVEFPPSSGPATIDRF